MAARLADLAVLYASERGRLGRMIDRIVGNSATAEDLVHDTFVRAIEGTATEVRNDRAYLTRIARNAAIDQKRKDARLADISEEAYFSFADPSPSPEVVAADRQALALTVEVISTLPERTRKALEMHRLGEHTLEQIGKALGISTSLAGRLVFEGYRIVRKRLREAGVD